MIVIGWYRLHIIELEQREMSVMTRMQTLVHSRVGMVAIMLSTDRGNVIYRGVSPTEFTKSNWERYGKMKY